MEPQARIHYTRYSHNDEVYKVRWWKDKFSWLNIVLASVFFAFAYMTGAMAFPHMLASWATGMPLGMQSTALLYEALSVLFLTILLGNMCAQTLREAFVTTYKKLYSNFRTQGIEFDVGRSGWHRNYLLPERAYINRVIASRVEQLQYFVDNVGAIHDRVATIVAGFPQIMPLAECWNSNGQFNFWPTDEAYSFTDLVAYKLAFDTIAEHPQGPTSMTWFNWSRESIEAEIQNRLASVGNFSVRKEADKYLEEVSLI